MVGRTNQQTTNTRGQRFLPCSWPPNFVGPFVAIPEAHACATTAILIDKREEEYSWEWAWNAAYTAICGRLLGNVEAAVVEIALRSMPSFFIRLRSVLGWRSRILAAPRSPSITQDVC